MLNKYAELTVSKLLYLGLPTISLLVTGFVNFDPVNVGKMVLTAGVGLSLLSLALKYGRTILIKEHKLAAIALIWFSLAGVVTSLFSEAPFVQNLYGVFGRNTGLLTYISLVGILFGALLINSRDHFQKIVHGLLVAGTLNAIFCALELMGANIFGFNNIYGEILGTFGNPNFISSFLGIFVSVLLAYFVLGSFNLGQKILALSVAGLAFFEIIMSKSVQGVVVTALGISYCGFLFVRSRFKSFLYQGAYLGFASVGAIFAVAGALQIGPLTSLIYKGSVSLRGEYWRAGLKMAMDHPFTGVGFDTYGDWYRRTRSASAMIVPGPTVVTNSAHNVSIDIFSYGGFPVILPYLLLLFIAGISILKFIRRNKGFDPIFAAISVGWLCYQAQAIISINQIGLAVWGWALTGLVISYERVTRGSNVGEDKLVKPKSTANQGKDSSTYLIGVAGFALGIILAFPPFLADASWRSAMKAGSAEQVLATANRWPLDSYRLANISLTLAQNKLDAQAVDVARKGVLFNPDYFDAWEVMKGISGTSATEKTNALAQQKRLDPRNKTIK
jgi:hypothetical protein